MRWNYIDGNNKPNLLRGTSNPDWIRSLSGDAIALVNNWRSVSEAFVLDTSVGLG